MSTTLEHLRCDNRYAALGESYGSRVVPAPLSHPRLLHANPEVAALFDLDAAELSRPAFTAIFSGNKNFYLFCIVIKACGE